MTDKKEVKVAFTLKQMIQFQDSMNEMDKQAIKMFYDMLWSDIFVYFIQAVFLGVAFYMSWWIYLHLNIAPAPYPFLLFATVWFATAKQFLDGVSAVNNFLARLHHVKEAKIRVANYPEERKKFQQQWIEDSGKQDGK